jgi:nucleotide-binding universal stress UspA family protein
MIIRLIIPHHRIHYMKKKEVNEMVEIKKILFPCDFTENSTKILPYVRSFADKYDSMIYLLHVVQDLLKWGGFYIPHLSLTVYQREAIKSAEKTMEKVCMEHMEGCPNFQKMIVAGDPDDEILKNIETEGIDLVIMGTHGRRGMEHTILGSVAEKVVRKSPVPVLIVNPYELK